MPFGNRTLSATEMQRERLNSVSPVDLRALIPANITMNIHGSVFCHGFDSRYFLLHFEANQLPPATGFWSLTLYNASHQFYANPAGRYSLGSFNNPSLNEDGSLTITIQSTEPIGSQTANWLPSPSGEPYKLYLRLYAPMPTAIDGSWAPPRLKRISSDMAPDAYRVAHSKGAGE